MNNPFKKELDLQKRIQMLRDNCVRIEEMTYPRPFTEEEILEKKDNLSRQVIHLHKLEEEKKEVMTDFNSQIKEIDAEIKQNLAGIRTGVEEITGDVYLIDDQEEGVMNYYNSDGDIIQSRPLRKNERQLRLFTNTGTENQF